MKTNTQAGLTLLEVLASIVIVGLIVTTFFGFFSQSMLFSSKNEENLQAINIARKILVVVQEAKVSDLDRLDNDTKSEIGIKNDDPSLPYYIEDKKNNKYYVKVEPILDKATYSLTPISVQVSTTPFEDENAKITETFGYVKGVAHE
ncbi:type IV pilus modification PilV family protein [Bacillus suaedaesalsae]|uniref:Type II secretion system protein n=1 Tax=Bacillus suaedaesalsae TaxID=2810349 RepID=A0ABS2DMN5_9BACI|nr:type II secretion system protein [Bacillus suaedaesalsae]MBM6619759.1 type II secretion system protein [Bacillus suaedaesalsae]